MAESRADSADLRAGKVCLRLWHKEPRDISKGEDLLALAKEDMPERPKDWVPLLKEARALLMETVGDAKAPIALWEKAQNLYDRTGLWLARYDFDTYMLVLEGKRPAEKRFYYPRRKILLPVVEDIQKLVDGDIDELFLSMPPRIGKTTLTLFLVTFLIGRDPDRSNLYSAYSDTITGAFYSGLLEVIDDPVTYRWKDIFSDRKVPLKFRNAKDETLNVDRDRRYPSVTCRSISGTLNGACDCDGFLIADDLIGTIEEALSKDRLTSTWNKVDNNLIPRAKEQARIMWIGTRWSLADPIGRRKKLLESGGAYASRKFLEVNMPALDGNDESNFDYGYGVGFSTQFYRQRRASFEANGDSASWDAQYMGQPVERSGLLFPPEELSYFDGTIPDEAEWRFAPCDIAWGGGDFLSMPFFVLSRGQIYIPDVVFSNKDKSVTRPMVTEFIMRNRITSVRFEKNNGGDEYADDIGRMLREKGYKCSVMVAGARNVRKETRIYEAAPDIRKYFFLTPERQSAEYQAFMHNLCSFVLVGKNIHDDAPDSLAMGNDMLNELGNRIDVFQRPF